MDIKSLRIIACVARLQSFSRAAEEVCLSNAAVSAAVSRIEEEIGLPLLERSTRFVRLTPLGEQFLPRIQLLIKDYDALLADLGHTVKHRSGPVAVGCLASVAVRIMPRVLSLCRERHPDVRIEVRDAAANAVYEEVSSGRSDFAIVGTYAERPELEFHTLTADPIVLICPSGSPLANRKRVNVSELRQHPFIAMSRETGVRAVLEQTLGPLEQAFSIDQEVTQISSLIGMIEEGLGLSLVPALTLPRVLPPSLAVIRQVNPSMNRPLGLLRRIDRPLTPASLAVLEHVKGVMSGPLG